jgi:hypothetical protein
MTIYVSNDKLYSLLNSQENDILDFKSADLLLEPDGGNRHKIAKHLVGFANHRGGKLVFGVNDDREPEGKDILEEKSLGTISEICSTQISPPIEFSYTHFSADKGDLSEGSIFVVELQRGSSPIPHAIIEESNGEIRKREYRIRAGESTRLVSNEELLALFEDRTSTNLEASETIRFLLEKDDSPAATKHKPRYQYTFDRHFMKLDSDDETLIEKIRSEFSSGSDQAMKRIADAQYALTVSTILSHPEFSFISKSELLDRTDSQTDNLTFDLKSIEPSDIVLREDSNPLIDETDMEKPGIFPDYDSDYDYFKIPESAEVTIWKDFDGFDIHNDHFTLSFSIGLIEIGVGLPTSHPDSSAKPGEYGLRTKNMSKATMHVPIGVESEFKYPNQELSEFESYQAYCESVIEVFKTTFDWENYLENLPEPKIVEIGERVEEMHEELKEMKENET